MNSADFVFGGFAAACFVGFLALAALVRMQDRLAELKTERDAEIGKRVKAEMARDEARAQLSTSLRNLSQIPDDTTCSLDDALQDPWADEMRERWATDLPTSED